MTRTAPRTLLGAASALVIGSILLTGTAFAQSPSAAPVASIDPCATAVATIAPAASVAPVASVAPDASAAPEASAAPCASAAPAVTKISANTATTDELIAALTAAGVPMAQRWAREIEEYRPYDTADPTLQHLQDELAKYNPDPAVLDAILSVLQP